VLTEVEAQPDAEWGRCRQVDPDRGTRRRVNCIVWWRWLVSRSGTLFTEG